MLFGLTVYTKFLILRMVYKRKSWQEKLNINRELVIEKVERVFADIKVGQKMLIPTPQIVGAYIREILAGQQFDISTIRKNLAAKFGADITCPITTSIFVRIAAEAAYEQFQQGIPIDKITPFWRVILETPPAAKKLTFGTEFLKELRLKEGLGKR